MFRIISALLLNVATFSSLTVPLAAQGQQSSIEVRLLNDRPRSYENQHHTIVGKVDAWVTTPGVNAYYLKDDFGYRIRVVIAAERPIPETRVAVSGLVGVDGTSGDAYLAASQQWILPSAGAPAQGQAPVDSPRPEIPQEAPTGPNILLIVAIVAGVGAALVLLLRSRQSSPVVMQMPEPMPGPHGPSPVSDPVDPYFEGKTIKFARPVDTSGTLKLLPGRLQITGGADAGQEIRFLKTTSGPAEITFGRSDGPPHTHIQLRAQTVSRRHAVMRHDGGQWHLTNYSDTNPVLVNGGQLSVSGRVLEAGDVIEMGEVQFKFHPK